MNRTENLRLAGDLLLGSSPLQRYFLHRSQNRLTVLAYHGVEDVDAFELHLDLVTRSFTPVTIEQVASHIHSGIQLPKRPILLTFDDGDPSILNLGAPLLAERGIPAVAFVVAGFIDTALPFWWEEVASLINSAGHTSMVEKDAASIIRRLKSVDDGSRLHAIDELRLTATDRTPSRSQLSREELLELESLGVAIGNHSLTHPLLDRCPADKLLHEVEESDRVLTELLGHKPVAFAYPNGNAIPAVVDSIRRSGYEVAFLFDHRQEPLPIADPLRVSRVRVDSTARPDRFSILLSGLHPTMHHLRGRT